ncbi:MAG: type III-A CRISPR-associated RAMP protein Csm5 [Candidatus Aenigmatarchaeota archaeon]|nr:type III-A CRISPR-associated RAMP protein Csm5 [Methanothermobacter sp.]
MKFLLETISPVHIGNGSKIYPIEYILNKKFHRVDMDSLFRDEKFDPETFIDLTREEDLGDYQELAMKHLRYSLDITKFTKMDLKNSLGHPSAAVYEFIKTMDRVYIPGTTIKGAIRTAILWWVLKKDMDRFTREIERVLNNHRIRRENADDEIEKLVFGKSPNRDVLKALRVSDTKTKSTEDLSIKVVRILSTRRHGYGFKGFRIFIEALKPGVSTELEIKTDKFLLSNEIARELGFDDKKDLLVKIPDICNEFARDLIKHEKQFFEEYNVDGRLDPILKFYENLKIQKNQFLLHFAWGVGWHSMTIGRLLQNENDFFFRLRKKFRLGKRRNKPYYVKTFPKTRKIVCENGNPAYPLGWVKVIPK